MRKKNAYAVFLCFACMYVRGVQVAVCFRNGDGSRAETRKYDTKWTIFKVSEYLKEKMNEHVRGEAAEEEKGSEPQIVLDCEPKMFDVMAALLEGNVPDVEIKEKEVVGVLRLASSLGIASKKIELCDSLARATVSDKSFKEEIERHKDVQDIKLFMLLLLRDYTSRYGIDVRVCDNRATLCCNGEDTEGYCGSANKAEVVDKVRIYTGAVGMLMSLDRSALDLLKSFACVTEIGELEINSRYRSVCIDMMRCIGEMASLKTLRIRMNLYGQKLRGLEHLRGLTNLAELDVSGSGLECTGKRRFSLSECFRRAHARHTGLLAVTCLKGLTKLSIRNCRIGPGSLWCLRDLENLVELNVGDNVLNREDMYAIRSMKSLTKLDVSYCRLEPGNIEILQDMGQLRELNVASNRMSEEDMSAIGKMEGLVFLDVKSCSIGPGSLEHLKDLTNLAEADVSDNMLSKSDIAVIGRMQSLRKLAICDCTLGPGDLEPLGDLGGLEKLCISRTKLGLDEMQTLGKMWGLKILEACFCGLQAGSLEHLKGLENLEVLCVSLNTLGKEDMAVIGSMAGLTKLDVYGCGLESGSLVYIENLKNIQSLNISRNRLSEDDLKTVGGMRSITELDMYICDMDLGSIVHFKNMDNLRHLDLYRNKLSKVDMCAIGGIKGLTELNISSCNIELGSLAYICELKSLTSLCISDVLMLDSDENILNTKFPRDTYIYR